MANKQIKRCSTSPGKWKWKWTVRYHHIPIRTSKTGNWQQQMLKKIWRNRNSHSLRVGTQNGIATLEDNLAVSQESKHTPTIWSSNHDPWYLPKELKPSVHTECLYQLYSNAKTWKYTCDGILFSTEKKWEIKPLKDIQES